MAAIERCGPLHGTDHRTPYLSLLARCDDLTIADLDRAWLVERRLDRRAAMRGTLHLVPATRLPDIVSTFGPPSAAEHRPLRLAGIAAGEAERLAHAVEAVLGRDGRLSVNELKRALPDGLRARAAEKSASGLSVLAVVVRWLTDAGRLAVTAAPVLDGSPTSGWRRAPQLYEPLHRAFGPLGPREQPEADARLASWYFEAHGPAAFEDWAWWAGIGRRRSAAAFEAVRGGLVGVAVEGWPQPVYATPATLEDDVAGTAPEGPSVRLLPYEDSAIKAYRATRSRFFDPGVAETVHTRFGEILPSVLVDGHIAGTWSSGAGGWAGALGAATGRPDRGLGAELVAPVDRSVQRRLDDELARLAELMAATASPPFVDAPAGGG